MKNFNSIKKNSDFQNVYNKGKSYANKQLVMYVLDNMSEEQKKLPPPEVTLHFDKKGNGRVNISVKRNESLIKERKKIYEEKKII